MIFAAALSIQLTVGAASSATMRIVGLVTTLKVAAGVVPMWSYPLLGAATNRVYMYWQAHLSTYELSTL
jgi:hypothetical protein